LAKKKSFLKLSTPVKYIKGVGPKIAEILNKRGIFTVEDILNYYPRLYEDQKSRIKISGLRPGELVSLRGQLVRINSIPLGKTGRRIYELLIKDETGFVKCKFFRVPYKGYFERFQQGQCLQIIGKPQIYRGAIEFHHPELRDFESNTPEEDQILPIYPEIEHITSAKISKIIKTVLQMLPEDEWQESLPQTILDKYKLLPRVQAFKQLHQPESGLGEFLRRYRAPAQVRFIFEEFFWFELLMVKRLTQFKEVKTTPILIAPNFMQDVKPKIPFELTGAQERVLHEIFADLAKDRSMNRLVQGDVGSGKTMVAFLAALAVVRDERQVAIMAPTEILAEQHYKNALKFFSQFNVEIDFLAGSTAALSRKNILAKLESNKTKILIGTHALLEEPVKFSNLAFVVIDEQHRFGVKQRARLKQKGLEPHFLLMTATPIPRTLALTLYGDLDVSTIDELPKGRTPILTRVTHEGKRSRIYQFIQDQVREGRQAYIVYPLVEESEKVELKNATEEYQKLKSIFPDFRIGLLHGKMRATEKEAVMRQFRDHELDLLVSTTVIEVGVDVPNASIMLIEHAERFGLSQLHQLRGRVGRGPYKSYCILMPGFAISEESRHRLSVMENTTDGFKIAEADLELRGPGEFLGLRQSGDLGFRLANLVRDEQILIQAREAAISILAMDPRLELVENQPLRLKLDHLTHNSNWIATTA